MMVNKRRALIPNPVFQKNKKKLEREGAQNIRGVIGTQLYVMMVSYKILLLVVSS
jgi:hypothetical protein